ncbi:putative endo-beta-1,4-glucanase B [Lachnellula arida]|uniref:cellulase n=1 Tax=Lachnellula arida TaxID=1316785 RepID=A0A8T9BAP9_9HELO|nr:putative endo-beta-1,4-glucanase B [Lachnellula arida]
MHISSLLLSAATFSGAFAAPAATADERGVSVNKKRSNFWFAGVNESGAEFGSANLPGTKGTDYTWPLPSSVDTLMGKGFNIFRIPFLMERLVPGSLTSSVNAAYLADMQALVSHITGNGGYAAICAQNCGRYYGNIITDTSGFEAFWQTVRAIQGRRAHSLNQAAVNGGRNGTDDLRGGEFVYGGVDVVMGRGLARTVDYMFSVEPPSGTQYTGVVPSITQYI